jgi:hypothetical protein
MAIVLDEETTSASPASTGGARPGGTRLVDRDAELARLDQLVAEVQSSQRTTASASPRRRSSTMVVR